VGGVFSCKWPVVTAAEQNASRYFPQNMAVFSQKIAKRRARITKHQGKKSKRTDMKYFLASNATIFLQNSDRLTSKIGFTNLTAGSEKLAQ